MFVFTVGAQSLLNERWMILRNCFEVLWSRVKLIPAYFPKGLQPESLNPEASPTSFLCLVWESGKKMSRCQKTLVRLVIHQQATKSHGFIIPEFHPYLRNMLQSTGKTDLSVRVEYEEYLGWLAHSLWHRRHCINSSNLNSQARIPLVRL